MLRLSRLLPLLPLLSLLLLPLLRLLLLPLLRLLLLLLLRLPLLPLLLHLLQSKLLFHFQAGVSPAWKFPLFLSFLLLAPPSPPQKETLIHDLQQSLGCLGEIRCAVMAGNGKPESCCALRYGGWPDGCGKDPLFSE